MVGPGTHVNCKNNRQIQLDSGLEAVPHELVWRGRDDSDKPVGSGVYFIRVSGKGYSMEAKLVLLK